MRLFARRGYEAVMIDDVVRAAKVARGTFYFHFPSKDDVLLEAVHRGEQRIVASLESARKQPLRRALSTAIRAFAEEWEGKRELWPHAGAVALRRIGADASARASDPLRLVLTAAFDRAIAAREVTSLLPAQMLADVFLLNVFAALMAWSANGEPALDLLLPGVVELFLRGAEGIGTAPT
ncbi:MAG: TetR/AcrR family transcriptional regulator [Polyangiales bacterium]